MGVSFVGYPVTGNQINGANVTLTFPVPPAINDVVYVWGGHFGRSPDLSGPSTAGYTKVFLNIAGQPQFGSWRKTMTGSPDVVETSVTCLGGGNAADAVAYGAVVLRGVSLGTPEDVTVTSATGSSTNPDPPASGTIVT